MKTRRAIPYFEKPQFLQGKLTYIGLILSGIGMICKPFGIDLPDDEAKDFIRLLSSNWESFAEMAGLLVAAYGRFRASKRFQKQLTQ